MQGSHTLAYTYCNSLCWINDATSIATEEGTIFEKINTSVNTGNYTAVGGAGVVVSLIGYYSVLQLTLAAASGVVVGAGLMLAFTFKKARFDVQPPIYRRAPVSGQYFK